LVRQWVVLPQDLVPGLVTPRNAAVHINAEPSAATAARAVELATEVVTLAEQRYAANGVEKWHTVSSGA
jgi:hypothetical protein